MPAERLQKILSRAGVASRRKAEELMKDGLVTVNGQLVTELGTKADMMVDHIKVAGKILRPPRRELYIAFNKPKAVVTTMSDPQGRPTVVDYIKGLKERVYPVGRLDYASEGLLLLTNDGEFANRITSSKNKVTKVYVVKVNGLITPEQEEEFRNGIALHGKRTAPAGLKLIKRSDNPWYEVKLIEGRQNQIRLMFKHFGRLVEKLRRVKIGFLELDVKPGEFRQLSTFEIAKFKKVLKMETEENDE